MEEFLRRCKNELCVGLVRNVGIIVHFGLWACSFLRKIQVCEDPKWFIAEF